MSMIITSSGQAIIASSLVSGKALSLENVAIGDGNGSAVTPSAGQTALVNEVYRNTITRYTSATENGVNSIVIYFTIPSTTGGYTVREIGIYDSDGVLIAVGSTPEIYKADPTTGQNLNVTLRCTLAITSEVAITLSTDPYYSVIEEDIVTVTDSLLEAHNNDTGAHPSLGLPTGGSDGDILTKVGSTSRVVAWKTPITSIATLNYDESGNLYIS